LIRRHRCIAHDEFHSRHGHIQFLGDNLHQRRLHAHADIDLAGEHVHAIVSADAQPCIQPRRRRIRGRFRGHQAGRACGIGEAEADQQSAADGEKFAA